MSRSESSTRRAYRPGYLRRLVTVLPLSAFFDERRVVGLGLGLPVANVVVEVTSAVAESRVILMFSTLSSESVKFSRNAFRNAVLYPDSSWLTKASASALMVASDDFGNCFLNSVARFFRRSAYLEQVKSVSAWRKSSRG
jgi:hypothetical protein